MVSSMEEPSEIKLAIMAFIIEWYMIESGRSALARVGGLPELNTEQLKQDLHQQSEEMSGSRRSVFAAVDDDDGACITRSR
jgi:hypothetical protein